MGKYIDLSKLDREQLKELHIFMIQNDIRYERGAEFIVNYESQPYIFKYNETRKLWSEFWVCVRDTSELTEITLQQFFKLGKYD